MRIRLLCRHILTLFPARTKYTQTLPLGCIHDGEPVRKKIGMDLCSGIQIQQWNDTESGFVVAQDSLDGMRKRKYAKHEKYKWGHVKEQNQKQKAARPMLLERQWLDIMFYLDNVAEHEFEDINTKIMTSEIVVEYMHIRWNQDSIMMIIEIANHP